MRESSVVGYCKYRIELFKLITKNPNFAPLFHFAKVNFCQKLRQNVSRFRINKTALADLSLAVGGIGEVNCLIIPPISDVKEKF